MGVTDRDFGVGWHFDSEHSDQTCRDLAKALNARACLRARPTSAIGAMDLMPSGSVCFGRQVHVRELVDDRKTTTKTHISPQHWHRIQHFAQGSGAPDPPDRSGGPMHTTVTPALAPNQRSLARVPSGEAECALAVWTAENAAGRMTGYTLRTYMLVAERWVRFLTAHSVMDVNAVPETVVVDFINPSGITRHGAVTQASVSSRHLRRATLRHLYATLRSLDPDRVADRGGAGPPPGTVGASGRTAAGGVEPRIRETDQLPSGASGQHPSQARARARSAATVRHRTGDRRPIRAGRLRPTPTLPAGRSTR